MNPLDLLPAEVVSHLVEHFRLNPGTQMVNWPDPHHPRSHAFISITREHAQAHTRKMERPVTSVE